ncbi:hypothetical protein [Phenylobacterium sp.]|uniref:hypothetical protein n=1 Tax=Phenylobacterium sp. TaxID=1871053 RepID=UPI0027337833|nr:hypothetical protein [Phenylobacterium sp.]MDP3852084.1 hypothetical protein [Phenylobacterium sp.]
MARTDRRTLPSVVLVSVLAHLGVLALLAIAHPTLRQAQAPPVFEVSIAPLVMAPRRERPAPAASRPLRPRRALTPDETSPVAPLVTPNAPGRAEATPRHPAPLPPGPKDNLRNTLRRSAAGCANANAVILDKAERDDCDERFGRGAKTAEFIEPPMSRDKRRAFDAAAERKAAYRAYKEGNVPSGLSRGGSPSEVPNPFPEVWKPHN